MFKNIKSNTPALFVALLVLIIGGFASNTQAQDQKSYYWNTIRNFRKQDSLQALPQNAILFVGSSSFTNWHNVQQMFPDYIIVNRGFGGSQLPDVKQYFEQTVYPKKLKQIVLYAGDNDIAAGAKPEEVFDRFKQVYSLIRKDQPTLPIAYLSIKGCPGRARSIRTVQETNALIKAFLVKEKNAAYVDVYTATMDSEGQPLKQIYVEDGVHMNQQGYDIWARVLKPYLKK
ncbi:GDSL-type esterase/lipase family protein [uncultured Mucilaginibacter sp.]|uniref:GDSL-type esterase/lipase family protein n=1 Tax=uncultured Mucilaginibacter sp. TaxID=797541 RepID=UPI0025D11C91|nr:GDSL-type esterase/lipase family protein [uncultured Mucilaginibacter sp.]